MDYDRIRSKLGDASRELEALRSGESYDPDPAERRRRDCESFVKAFPEAAEQLRRDKGAIPAEVWDEVRRGASLTDAYAEHLRPSSSTPSSSVESVRSAQPRNCSPKRVSSVFRPDFSNSGTPSSRSSCAMAWLRLGWVMHRRSAARV